MHLGKVERILVKHVKHSAAPRVLHASLVFFQHSARALSHHNGTRLVSYLLNIHLTFGESLKESDRHIVYN